MNHARRDLCGGCAEMRIPTAIRLSSHSGLRLFRIVDNLRAVLSAEPIIRVS